MTTNIKGVGNMVSENKRASIDRYDDKTYKRMSIKFRRGDDDEMLQALKNEQEKGCPYRVTLQKWYQAYLESNK